MCANLAKTSPEKLATVQEEKYGTQMLVGKELSIVLKQCEIMYTLQVLFLLKGWMIEIMGEEKDATLLHHLSILTR